MTLGDYCLHITDGEHCTVQDDPAGEFYLLSNKNIIDGNILIDKNDRRINRETFEKINKRTLLDVNDVLISTVGTLGKTAVVKEPINYTFQRSVGILKPNPEKVDSYFLKYLLDTDYYQKILTDASAGAIQKCIFISTLKSLPINLPNIAIQQRTAKVLLELDRKIALNRQINQNLEALARQLYDYWFVQFDFPDANGKPYKSSGGKMVYNPILKREIPEGWENIKLAELVRLEDSKRIPLSTYERENRKGIYPYYGATGIMDYIDDYLFDDEIILLAEDGSTSDEHGFPIVQYVWGKVWVNNHAHIIYPQNPNHKIYTYFMLKLIPVKLIETGSIQKKINQDNLLKYNSIKVPTNILDDFTKIVSPLWRKKMITTEEILSLTKQRDELLPLLMNGQVNFDLSDD